MEKEESKYEVVMDPKVNVKIIGLGVVGILFFIVSILFVIHKNQYEQCSEMFKIYFDRPITGLRKGDQVVYNGIIAGRVKDMKPDFKNLKRVVVTVCLEKGFPIKKDAFAAVESKSITGGLIITIDPGSNEAGDLHKVGKEIPVIRSRESKLDQLMQNLPKTLASMERTFQKIADTFSKETQQDIQKSVKSLSMVMNRFEEIMKKNEHGINTWLSDGSSKFNNFLDKSADTLKTLDQTLQSINKSPRRFLYADQSHGVVPK